MKFDKTVVFVLKSRPMNRNFLRILDLVRKTGDRLVITDFQGDEAFVVMDLDQYELMIGGSDVSAANPQVKLAKKDDFEHINEEIENWRESQKDKITEELAENIDSDEVDPSDGLDEEERFYLEPIE